MTTSDKSTSEKNPYVALRKVKQGRWTDWSVLLFGRTLAEFRLGAEDEYNRSGFYAKLLNVAVWDMATAEFAFEFELGVDGGRVALRVPFLMIAVTILPRLDPHHATWRTKR